MSNQRLMNKSMVNTIYNCIVSFGEYTRTIDYLKKEKKESERSIFARYEPGAISYEEKVHSTSNGSYDSFYYEQADKEKWIQSKIDVAEKEKNRAKGYVMQLMSNCDDEEKVFIESFINSVNNKNIKQGEGYENSTKEMKRMIWKYCDY